MTWTRSRHRRIIRYIKRDEGSRDEMVGAGQRGSRADAIAAHQKAMLIAAEKNQELLGRANVQAVHEPRKFYLNTTCTANEFRLFQEQLKQYNLEVAPYSIPVVVDGVKVDVPVTPLKPTNINNAGYHFIVLRSPYDLHEIHFAVENFSGYIKAFAVVLRGQISPYEMWYRLGKDKIASRFSPSVFTAYGHGYGTLNGIYMDCGMFEVIFNFFLNLKANPGQVTTNRGKRIVYTTFISLGESPRFPFVMEWTAEGLSRDSRNRLKLPNGFSVLVHDWSNLSNLVYELLIALLEAQMTKKGTPTPNAKQAMVNARILWSNRQVAHKLIRFFVKKEGVAVEATNIVLSALCGRHLSQLRHDYEVFNKVKLREHGYTGYLSLDEIEAAYRDGTLS